MFGTLRHDSLSNDIVFMNHSSADKSDGPITVHHIACNKCRAEKLKCSGNRFGCSRCKARNTKCVYTSNFRGEGSKRQRQGPNGSNELRWQESPANEVEALPEGEANPPHFLEQRKRSSQSLEDQPEIHTKVSHISSRAAAQPQPQESRQLPSPASETDSIMSKMVQDFLPPNDFFPADTAAMEIAFGCENMGAGSESFNPILQERGLPLEDGSNGETTASARLPRASRPSPFRSLSPTATQPFEGVYMDSPFHPNSPASSHFHPHLSPFHENSFYLDQGSPRQTASVSLEMRKQPIADSPAPVNCKCLQEIGNLLSDLEHHRSRAATVPLDCTLSYHKSALAQLSALVSCQKCQTRPEFLVLLGVVCEKSTALCETMLSQHPPRQCLASPAAKDGGSITMAGERFEMATIDVHVTSKTAFLGDYEVNSVAEWQLLMKVLVDLQLSNLHNVLIVIKSLMNPLPNGAQHTTLLMTIEKRVRSLAAKPISGGV